MQNVTLLIFNTFFLVLKWRNVSKKVSTNIAGIKIEIYENWAIMQVLKSIYKYDDVLMYIIKRLFWPYRWNR